MRTTMSEAFRIQLNDLRDLPPHIPHNPPLPQVKLCVPLRATPLMNEVWLEKIENEGVVNRDLEIMFADCSIQEDSFERSIRTFVSANLLLCGIQM